jgi:hypothetical protein
MKNFLIELVEPAVKPQVEPTVTPSERPNEGPNPYSVPTPGIPSPPKG